MSIGLHLLCAILLVGGLHFSRNHLLAPLVAKQRVTRQRSEQLNRLLQSSSQVAQQHTKLVTSLRDIKRRDSEARARVPLKSREDEVLEKLMMKANERSVKVKDYRRQKVVVHNGYNELGIGIACAGDFASICGLLHDLTTLSRVVHVKKLTMSQSNEGCSAKLDLALFFGAAKPSAEEGKEGKEGEKVARQPSSANSPLSVMGIGQQNQQSPRLNRRSARS